MKKAIIISFICLMGLLPPWHPGALATGNLPPEIVITDIVPRYDGSGYIDVQFTGADPEGDAVTWYEPSYYCTYQKGPAFDENIPLMYVPDDPLFTAVEPMTFSPEGTPYNLVIDAASWTAGEYKIRLKVMDEGGLFNDYAYTDPFYYDGPAASVDNVISIAPGTQAADFRMISFTLRFDDASPEMLFGDDMGAYDTQYYRIGTYNPEKGDGGYEEYGSDLGDITPGKAYWIFARNGLDIAFSGIPVSATDAADVPLAYNSQSGNGWNMIACPNDADYQWEKIEVLKADGEGGKTSLGQLSSLEDANPYLDLRLWRWENGDYAADTQMMESGGGYWVKARSKNVYLRFHPDAQVTSSGLTAAIGRSLNSVRQWIADSMIAPEPVFAATGESPPEPMGGFTIVTGEPSDRVDSDGGGCFIGAAGLPSFFEKFQ